MLGANALAFALIARRGRWTDRLAILVLIGAIVIEELVDGLYWGGWRIGVAITNLVLFLVLWILAELGNRWWLVFASGFQLIIVLTHLIPLLRPGYLVDTGVAIRLLLWGLLSITFFVGALEAWAADRFAREGNPCPDPRLQKPVEPGSRYS